MPLDHQVLIRYLQDAHALETGTLEQLDAFNPGYASIDTSDLIARYKLVCEDQLRTVTMRLESYGARQSATKGFVNVLFGKANEWVNVNQTGEDRTTLLLVRYYGSAQTKGAMYEAIYAYATELGDKETADFALKFRHLEFEWAVAMFPLIAESTREGEKPTPPPFVV
jgi:Domain of unknown function (DUF892)